METQHTESNTGEISSEEGKVSVEVPFHYDPESGFVYDRENDEWLTEVDEVYLAMSEFIDKINSRYDVK